MRKDLVRLESFFNFIISTDRDLWDKIKKDKGNNRENNTKFLAKLFDRKEEYLELFKKDNKDIENKY